MISTLAFPQTPYNLGPVEQVPVGEGRVFLVGSRAIAIFRPREGGLYATQAHCPHSGGPLADGLIGNDQVVCPLHAYKYCLKSGHRIGNSDSALATYRVALNHAAEIVVELIR